VESETTVPVGQFWDLCRKFKNRTHVSSLEFPSPISISPIEMFDKKDDRFQADDAQIVDALVWVPSAVHHWFRVLDSVIHGSKAA
jgi:hypothetical protein